MKPRSILIVSLVVLAGWVVAVIYLSGNAMEAGSAALDTLTPESYLPLVYRQPTPTSTPPPTLPPVYIMDNHSSFAHGDGGYSVVGEVRNNTGSSLWNVVVGAKFYKTGKSRPVNSISHQLYFLFRLKPGSRTCFSLDAGSGSVDDWDYYVFDEVSYLTDSVLPPLITRLDDDGTALPDRYHLSGQVRNDHTEPIYNTRVQGALYDKNGIVLDCRWENTLIRELSVGQTSFYEINFTSRKDGYGDVDRYRVERQAEWFYG
jgi:hypothetical protein